MSFNAKLLLVVLIAAMQPAVMLPAPPAFASTEAREPHDFLAFGMDCRSCHRSVGLTKSGGLVKPVTAICTECHDLSGETVHPVDMKPTFGMPKGLPLDEQGKMTCATCHDPHKSYRNVVTGEKTMYLRREGSKKMFCAACHGKR